MKTEKKEKPKKDYGLIKSNIDIYRLLNEFVKTA